MSTAKDSREEIAFGEFRLDPADERLLGPAGPIKLGNKAFRVLARLIEEEGRLVTKDALFSSVWDGTIVSESALTSVIKELRRALGDESRTPQYIESVYGRGYRLIAAVERRQATAAPRPQNGQESGRPRVEFVEPLDVPTDSTGALSSPAVAVLPFERAGAQDDDPGVPIRIAEDLVELLTRVRWIPVVAQAATSGWSTATSTMREIGAALGARYVVEGRIDDRTAGMTLTVTISSTESSRMLWSRRIALPQERAHAALHPLLVELVGALSSQIEDQEMRRAIALPADALEVNDLIWRARWHSSQYSRDGNRTAEALLNEALEKAPHSTEAIIQVAFCRHRDVWYRRGERDEIMKLRRLAQQAIAADEYDGRGYMIAGIAELWMRHSRTAITLLEQAIALNPCLGYAHAQLGGAYYLGGQPEQALAALDEALRLDVGEHQAYYVQGEIAMARAMLEQWDEAIEAAEQSIMRRMGYWYAHLVKVHALASRGDVALAADAYADLRAAKPSFSSELIDWLPFVDRSWPERLKQSLELAGHQEPPAPKVESARSLQA